MRSDWELTCDHKRKLGLDAWYWRPKSCTLPKVFDPVSFCHSLRGNLLLVGDSLTGILRGELQWLLGAVGSYSFSDYTHAVNGPCKKVAQSASGISLNLAGGLQMNEICAASGAQARCLVFVRNDNLGLKKAYPAPHFDRYASAKYKRKRVQEGKLCFPSGGNFHCSTWAHPSWITEAAFAHIVVNSGAHVLRKEGEYAKDVAAAAIFLERYAHRKGVQVIFRTTVPGHPNCDSTTFSPPLSKVRDAECLIATEHRGYGWAKFKKENALAENVFRRHNAEIMDVYPSSVLRWDGHIGGGDCLHYCIGASTLSSWAIFLGMHIGEAGGG
jgi:hypothetical protein